MKKQKIKLPRNWTAVEAFHRKAGAMTDERKAKSKNACRDWEDEIEDVDGYGEFEWFENVNKI